MMREILEKLTEVDEEQEDRYDPEKNLRSKVIDIFYKEGFVLVGEDQAATGVHLEFKEGDNTVKVFV